MRSIVTAAMVTSLLLLTPGCKHEQEQLIRDAERESFSGAPRNISVDLTHSMRHTLGENPSTGSPWD